MLNQDPPYLTRIHLIYPDPAASTRRGFGAGVMEGSVDAIRCYAGVPLPRQPIERTGGVAARCADGTVVGASLLAGHSASVEEMIPD